MEKQIVEYLREHGKMSRCDICSDLGINEVDMMLLVQDSLEIVKNSPAPCGSGTWYEVKK